MSSTWVGGEAGVDPGVLLLHLLHDQDGLARAHGADDHLPLVRGRLHHLPPVLALINDSSPSMFFSSTPFFCQDITVCS